MAFGFSGANDGCLSLAHLSSWSKNSRQSHWYYCSSFRRILISTNDGLSLAFQSDPNVPFEHDFSLDDVFGDGEKALGLDCDFICGGEFFYFPALFIFALWQRKNLPKRREITFSIIAFASTFLPLLLFDIKHAGILSGNIKKFLLEERSFAPPTWRFVLDKMEFYYSVVSNKIFYGVYEKETIILSLIALAFVYYLSVLLKNDRVKVLLLLLASPFLGLIFFQGNFGNIYDYYLTGYYLIFILLLAVTLGQLWKFFLGKVFVVYFLYFFLSNNLLPLYATLTDRAEDDRSVAFVNQKKAIEWIYQDAKDKNFNVDIYVPPVIPYAYDYLFKWYGGSRYARQPVETQVPLLYTLYEVDPSHPERLEAWLKRQAGIGKAEQGASFGGITVQRRTRR